MLTPESRWANAADEPSAPPPPAEAETESTLEGTERTRVEVFERRVDKRQDDAKRRFAGRDAEGFEPTGTVTETGTYRRGILRVDVDADGAPKNFLCPITQSLLEDPVIWVDGHTYERTAIARWLRTKDTSPMTGERFRGAREVLLPNHAMRSQVEEMAGTKSSRGRTRTVARGVRAREGHLRMRTFDARARTSAETTAPPARACARHRSARLSCADSIFSTLVSQIAYFFVDGR